MDRKGRDRRREGGKETEEKCKGEETEGKRQTVGTRDQDRGGGGGREKRGIYRGETMESDRVEK